MKTTLVQRLVKDEEGANAVEYGLIAAVIAVAMIVAFTFFRQRLSDLFNTQANTIGNAH